MTIRIMLWLAMIGGIIYAAAGLVTVGLDTTMLTGLTVTAVALGGYGLVELVDR